MSKTTAAFVALVDAMREEGLTIELCAAELALLVRDALDMIQPDDDMEGATAAVVATELEAIATELGA